MNTAIVAMATGMALGFAAYFGGFSAFLLVAALGVIGWAAGRWADGGLDLDRILRRGDRW